VIDDESHVLAVSLLSLTMILVALYEICSSLVRGGNGRLESGTWNKGQRICKSVDIDQIAGLEWLYVSRETEEFISELSQVKTLKLS